MQELIANQNNSDGQVDVLLDPPKTELIDFACRRSLKRSMGL